MTTRRILLAAFAVAPMLLGTAAGAAEMAYTPAAFEAAQKAGKPILVHITAPWCTTCAAQKPILSKLEADPKFKDLQVFDVDFDSRKDVVKQFGATMQSTLITYKGEKETGRSAGETKPEAISALLDKAI
ncbi:thioredoxin family protein [Methylorubrum extorquens]|jgi:thiol-disulfide isomerase/thioredoxin|uniref:Thioredoxin-related n=1 Tax=Methylorubrum extorquens (strain ATCC 14718 / DSM 1338 / JCM 2805 / NCIMB 9133 / AM1) TaxID=272630 RepID=C5AYI8_METEA|nr:thioredoxin family protein [Methylorubrum extorquens]ACS39104.1 Thioredoxin-related [Methylorubrum extorquens AM1]MCP1542790.1 thiol-disulfide isomerase/thioredoxin [Methylorubrum extorquens]MCP1589865.1 thiol-disulfide isomerase/thioredoxin [Methylorubrum extorquens]